MDLVRRSSKSLFIEIILDDSFGSSELKKIHSDGVGMTLNLAQKFFTTNYYDGLREAFECLLGICSIGVSHKFGNNKISAKIFLKERGLVEIFRLGWTVIDSDAEKISKLSERNGGPFKGMESKDKVLLELMNLYSVTNPDFWDGFSEYQEKQNEIDKQSNYFQLKWHLLGRSWVLFRKKETKYGIAAPIRTAILTIVSFGYPRLYFGINDLREIEKQLSKSQCGLNELAKKKISDYSSYFKESTCSQVEFNTESLADTIDRLINSKFNDGKGELKYVDREVLRGIISNPDWLDSKPIKFCSPVDGNQISNFGKEILTKIKEMHGDFVNINAVEERFNNICLNSDIHKKKDLELLLSIPDYILLEQLKRSLIGELEIFKYQVKRIFATKVSIDFSLGSETYGMNEDFINDLSKKRVFDKDEMKILSWYKVLDLDITEIEMLLNYDSWDENTEHLLTERSNDDRQSAFYIFDHFVDKKIIDYPLLKTNDINNEKVLIVNKDQIQKYSDQNIRKLLDLKWLFTQEDFNFLSELCESRRYQPYDDSFIVIDTSHIAYKEGINENNHSTFDNIFFAIEYFVGNGKIDHGYKSLKESGLLITDDRDVNYDFNY